MTFKEVIKSYEGRIINVLIENKDLETTYPIYVKEANFDDEEIIITNNEGHMLELGNIHSICGTPTDTLPNVYITLTNGTKVSFLP